MTLKVKNTKFLLLLIPALVLAFAFKGGEKKKKVGEIKTIVIDAGHGGKDPGCNGAFAKEKDVSLAVALKLGKLIESQFKDVKVIYTRTTDVFVDLEDRAQIANKAKADLFISIHCNAAGKVVKYKDPKTGKMKVKMRKNKKGKFVPVETTNPVPFGTETYVMGLKNEEGKMRVATRENSVIYLEDNYETKYEGFDPDSEESYIIMSNYTSAYVIQSANLALKIQDEYTKKAGRIDKGVHRQSIWVLWRTAMPSILTEIGYLTNPLEEQFLASDKGQDYLAKAIFRGLRKYKDELEGDKKDYTDEIENQEPLENENIKAGNIPGQKKASDEDDEDDNGDNDGNKNGNDDKQDKNDKKEEDKKEVDKKDEKKEEKKEEKTETKTEQKEIKATETKTVAANKETEKDSVVSAKNIADKFKKDNKPKEENKKEEVKSAEKKEEKKEEKKNDAKNTESIVFKVQFASSDVEFNLKDKKFEAVQNGAYYKMKNVFKYTSGSFNNINDAVAHQKQLRDAGFKDCFVIAMKNGERMDVNEARKILGQ